MTHATTIPRKDTRGAYVYPLPDAPASRKPAPKFPRPAAGRYELREEPPDYDADAGTHYRDDPEACRAAAEHAEALMQAMGRIDDAINLVGLLLAAMEDVGDTRSMRATTALEVIEKALNAAHEHLDAHHSRHDDLFFAYLALKGAGEREPDEPGSD